MRRLTLLLCLLMIATLRWIIGSAEALATTEQDEALLRTPDLTVEAVNTGFKVGLVAASIRAEDAAWFIHGPQWAGLMQVRIQPDAILSRLYAQPALEVPISGSTDATGSLTCGTKRDSFRIAAIRLEGRPLASRPLDSGVPRVSTFWRR